MNATIEQIQNQQTYIMIKPDGVKKGVVGQIISRIEQADLTIKKLKMQTATSEQIQKHYPINNQKWVERVGGKGLSSFESQGVNPKSIIGTDNKLEIGQMVVNSLVEYMTSGPVVCILAEGTLAIEKVRKIVGNTIPATAEPGTIRGDFSSDTAILALMQKRSVHNIIHASETIEEAQNEINIWFNN